MKRTFALLFTSALLVFSLTACNTYEKVKDDVATAKDPLVNGANDVVNGANAAGNSVKDAITGANRQTATNGATYGQVLRNGQVSDTNGNLNDPENTVRADTMY